MWKKKEPPDADKRTPAKNLLCIHNGHCFVVQRMKCCIAVVCWSVWVPLAQWNCLFVFCLDLARSPTSSLFKSRAALICGLPKPYEEGNWAFVWSALKSYPNIEKSTSVIEGINLRCGLLQNHQCLWFVHLIGFSLLTEITLWFFLSTHCWGSLKRFKKNGYWICVCVCVCERECDGEWEAHMRVHTQSSEMMEWSNCNPGIFSHINSNCEG